MEEEKQLERSLTDDADERDKGAPGGSVARSRSPLGLGYCSKDEAEQVLRVLGAAGVPARLGFDRQFSERHAAATRVDPPIRRRSSYRDVRSGYFVEIPEVELDRARAALAGTSFRHLVERDSRTRRCAACDRPLPPGRDVCIHCGDDAPDDCETGRLVRRRSTTRWIAVLFLLVAVALLIERRLR